MSVAKTRYILMSESEQVNSNGNKRIDLFTFPINQFVQNDVLLDWTLSENDVFRFDHFISSHYGKTEVYLGFVKWYNQLFEMDERWIGKKIKLPSKTDIDRFYRDNLIKFDRG